VKLLIVLPRLPVPPLDGLTLYLYHVLPALMEICNVTFACYSASPEDIVRFQSHYGSQIDLNSYGTNNKLQFSFSRHLSLLPPTLAYDKHFSDWIKAILRSNRYDIGMICGASLGHFVLDMYRLFPTIYIPLDSSARNAFMFGRASPLPHKITAWIQSAKCFWYERTIARYADATVFVSPIDMTYVSGKYSSERCHVVPNGVNYNQFKPLDDMQKQFDVVVSGNFSYAPNAEGLIHFLNIVEAASDSASRKWKLLVCGRRGPLQLQRRLEKQQNVLVCWDVPDMAKAIQHARVYACPVRFGSGIRNNVLQAMACAMPVVTYPINVEAIRGRNERHYVCASTEREFCVQIDKLLNSPLDAKMIGEMGREYVVANHDWTQVGQRILSIVLSCVTRARSG
jgi:polysaccharide biosynthesis protein PslH